jgi:chromosome partitioning protein
VTGSVYQVLIGMSDTAGSVQPAAAGGYSVLPANRELAGAELELVDLDERERRLLQALMTIDDQYDFMLIDCPPSLSLLTLNGFCAAHGVIIPMQCEYYALEGLSDLVNTIRKVHANFNPELEITGLLRVMFDPRVTLSQQVSGQLETHFGDKVFRTIIPRNVRLAEAPSYGMPGIVFDPQSKGAKAYLEFGAELLVRIGRSGTKIKRSASRAREGAAQQPPASARAESPQPDLERQPPGAQQAESRRLESPPRDTRPPERQQPAAQQPAAQQPAAQQPAAQQPGPQRRESQPSESPPLAPRQPVPHDADDDMPPIHGSRFTIPAAQR